MYTFQSKSVQRALILLSPLIIERKRITRDILNSMIEKIEEMLFRVIKYIKFP